MNNCSVCNEPTLFEVENKFICSECSDKAKKKWKKGAVVEFDVITRDSREEEFSYEQIKDCIKSNGNIDMNKLDYSIKEHLKIYSYEDIEIESITPKK